ncbi:MAG: DUF4147 domain-containing protein [Longimicrobiales bacterium]|nr:DUF4147 domain-containing protein [Longimicrobiales bacterium]
MTAPPPDPSSPSPAAHLRRDALRILAEGVRAAEPARLVAGALADDPELERWAHEVAGAGAGGRTVLVGVGKAAPAMARGAAHLLGPLLDGGVLLAPHGAVRPQGLPSTMVLRGGGHPLPDAAGVEAAEEIRDLAAGLSNGDRLLALISGGGSALLSLPRPPLDLHGLRSATRLLLESGAPIGVVNRVRARLELLKGGGLAEVAAPARVLGLVLSDIPGGHAELVASGPLSPLPPDAREEAAVRALLRRPEVRDRMPAAVWQVLESEAVRSEVGAPGRGPAAGPDQDAARRGPPTGPPAVLRMVGSGRDAAEGAARAARALGYATRVVTTAFRGEARAVGRGLARMGMAIRDGAAPPRPPACLVLAGETTVHVTGSGSGGRNQEVALGAALALAGWDGIVVASLGTDGRDGPTDAAGALADGTTVSRARAGGRSVAGALAANDAYPLLAGLGDLLRTGATGTNVADLLLVLVSADGRGNSP